MLAPDDAYISLVNLASVPAFSSMLIVKPFLVSVCTVAGIRATLFSLVKVSLGTPIEISLYGMPEIKLIQYNIYKWHVYS